jgi:uncharacterized integral membrane protein (TIGR00697 family)
MDNMHPFLGMAGMWLSGLALLALGWRYFGLYGLYVFQALAVVVANMQVLTAGVWWPGTPLVAHGTLVFTASFLATDVIAARVGRRAAQRSIGIGFFAMAAVLLWMGWIVWMGEPVTEGDPGLAHFVTGYWALHRIFSPSPAIMVASLVAYGVSHWVDIALFVGLQRRMPGVGWRSVLSATVATTLDTVVFSVLAWRWLSPSPVDHEVLWVHYIGGTLVLRWMVAWLHAPLLRLFLKVPSKLPVCAED